MLWFPSTQVASVIQEEPSGPYRSSYTCCPTALGAATSGSELVSGSTGKGILVAEDHRGTEVAVSCGGYIGEPVHASKKKGRAAPKVPAKVAVQPQKEINSATAWANYQEQDLDKDPPSVHHNAIREIQSMRQNIII
ncbi:hypothetical protein AcW2_004225 [Taiwanofungus camphoratus]|nr:hypothetical protein AcW2_004225 [Antrodia cinnamomea]